MNLWALIDREICKKFSASEMEKLCPELDWHGGHSGVLVSAETGEKIFLHLFMHLMGNLGPNASILFDSVDRSELVKILLKYGANPKAKLDGNTPLEFAKSELEGYPSKRSELNKTIEILSELETEGTSNITLTEEL